MWLIGAVALYALVIVAVLVMCKSAKINDAHSERWAAARDREERAAEAEAVKRWKQTYPDDRVPLSATPQPGRRHLRLVDSGSPTPQRQPPQQR
jgi:hypothetical protein